MNLRLEADREASGKRLDQFLKDVLPDVSRGRIQKAIRGGSCLLDGQPVTDSSIRLKMGQKVAFAMADDKSELKAEEGELKIVWNDSDMAVCDKPPNLTVHPCPSCPENTLVQRLLSRFPQLAQMEGSRPGIVHRLDKDTSGLLLAALSEKARLKLIDAFAGRKIDKEYLALVHGVPAASGECAEPVGRHPEIRTKMAVVPESKGGKSAHTVWKRLWHSPDKKFSLLSVKIHTGRTHQIRAHMAHLGYPLLGDRLYAPPAVRDMAPRQMLHASRLKLFHPISGEPLSFFSPLPEDFLQTIFKNSERPVNIVITGNPGSGKSTLAKALAAHGLPVIDADAIIARLYSSPGDVSAWLSMRGFEEVLAPNGSVVKTRLMELFESRPEVRREFEKFVHSLALDKIKEFWRENTDQAATVAEIPLFFEAGWQTLADYNNIMAVGVRSGLSARSERLASSRNWSAEKIAAMESWQTPEDEKMSLCDLVYENTAERSALAESADDLLNRVAARREEERKELAARINALQVRTDNQDI